MPRINCTGLLVFIAVVATSSTWAEEMGLPFSAVPVHIVRGAEGYVRFMGEGLLDLGHSGEPAIPYQVRKSSSRQTPI